MPITPGIGRVQEKSAHECTVYNAWFQIQPHVHALYIAYIREQNTRLHTPGDDTIMRGGRGGPKMTRESHENHIERTWQHWSTKETWEGNTFPLCRHVFKILDTATCPTPAKVIKKARPRKTKLRLPCTRHKRAQLSA